MPSKNLSLSSRLNELYPSIAPTASSSIANGTSGMPTIEHIRNSAAGTIAIVISKPIPADFQTSARIAPTTENTCFGKNTGGIITIINLALEGRLPDLTNGARYFQNPRIVADRAGAGQVPASLVNFGGAPPSAIIGAHSFYAETGRGGGRRAGGEAVPASHAAGSDVVLRTAGGAIFVIADKGPTAEGDAPRPTGTEPAEAPADTGGAGSTGPEGAMFVVAAHPGSDN